MHYFILLFMLAGPLVGVAQFKWAHQIGNTGFDMVQDHVIDPDGNIIVTGFFEKSVTIDGIEVTSTDESDIFLYKTKPNGDVLWVKTFAGPSYGGDVGIDTDADGNIYVAGGFIQEVYFDGVLKLSALAGNNYWNSFVTKIDTNGNMKWIKGIFGGTTLSEVRVWGLISVSENGFVLAGNFSTAVMIDNQVLSNPLGFQGNNLFIARFDLNGNLRWIKNPPSETNIECRKILLEDSGNIYLTGAFTNTVHFDTFTMTATNTTHSDIYLAKLNATGVTQWVKTGLKMADREDNNQGVSFTIDYHGNIYLIGIMKGDVKFDNLILRGNADPEYWLTDSFVIKYNTNGDLLQGSLFGEGSEDLTDIHFAQGQLFATGMTEGVNQFFYSILHPTELTGQTTLLTGNGFPLMISISPIDKAIFISGIMSFLTADKIELTTKGGEDGFIARVGFCEIAYNPFFENVITPNDDGKNDFFVIDTSLLNSELRIFNRWGVEVFQSHSYNNLWNAANLTNGVYYYSLSNSCITKAFKGWIHVIKEDD